MRTMYEEGCKLLNELETGRYREEQEGEIEERYRFELYRLKIRGEEKNMKVDDVSVLRREVEEAKRCCE